MKKEYGNVDVILCARARFVGRLRQRAKPEAEYPFPNDEAELERLDMQHAMMTLLLSNKLYCSPLPSDI